MVVHYIHFGTTYQSHLQRACSPQSLTAEDRPAMLSQNIGNQLPSYITQKTARTSMVLHTGPIIPSFLWILQLYDTAHIHIAGSVVSLAAADRSSCCTNIVCFCIISCSTRQHSGNATPVQKATKSSYNEIRPYNTTAFIIFRSRKMPT